MSSPGQVAGATQDAAGATASTAKDEASQVGSAATSAAADVAGTTKEQAGAVAGEAVNQVRDLLDQTRAQVTEQAGTAQAKLGESLRSLVDELRSMGEGSGNGQGPAAELARTLADRGSAFADMISDKQPGELVQELRTFAARRPGGFLLGALAAGVVAGRLTRGVKDASSSDDSGTSALPARTTTAYDDVALADPYDTAPHLGDTTTTAAYTDTQYQQPVGLEVDEVETAAYPSDRAYPSDGAYADDAAYPDDLTRPSAGVPRTTGSGL